MKLNMFCKKYHGVAVEDAGAYMSTEAKRCANNFKSLIKEYFEPLGFELVNWNAGHYDVSGFIKRGATCIYISWDIPRYGKPIDVNVSSVHNGVLFRQANDEKDYTGKFNNFSSITNLKGQILSLVQRIEK